MSRPPKYCHWKRDRRGGGYWYFERRGYARVRMPGLPWSPDFMAAHEAAMKGEPLQIGASRVQAGTMADLIAKYYSSPSWRSLKPLSQKAYRRIIDKLRENHGSKLVNALQARHIRIIAASIEAPSMQRLFITIMKTLLKHGISCGMLDTNAARDVETPPRNSRDRHTWTEQEIAQFEASYPVGSRERLALALMLYTGQRISDAVRMGPQHIKDGILHIVQEKTGAELDIPVHPKLGEIINASKSGHLAFLITQYGMPFTAKGGVQYFEKICQDAGLPDYCRSHGLRKAAARRLAEAGCSPHEIMSITGHKTLREVERYTRAVDRKKQARTAQAKILAAFPALADEE
jgi:integrase